MTIRTKRKTLIAGSLAFGLLAALQLPLANAQSAQSEHEGHHPGQAPAQHNAKPGTGEANKGQHPQQMQKQMQMDHGDMNHHQMMQQMHEQHMGNGHMDHGSKGPEKHSKPAAKERKDAE